MNEKKLDLNVGDTVYYVTGHDALYSIRKTRIDRVIKRIYILSVLDEGRTRLTLRRCFSRRRRPYYMWSFF